MITQDEPWLHVLGMRDHFILDDFDAFNYGYFDSIDELLSHTVITIKKLYLVRKDLSIAWAIFIDSVAGMRIHLGYKFSQVISVLVYYNPLLEPLENKINEKNRDLEKILEDEYDIKNWEMGLPKIRGLYYVDKEYAIINLNLKQRKSISDKLDYLMKLSDFYDTILKEVPYNYQDAQIKGYFSFSVFYAQSLLLYGEQLEKIKAKKDEISRITFVDNSIIDQVYYALIHSRDNPKDKPRLILKKDQERLSRFLREGTTHNNTKIFFRGDAKTLTYCFTELYMNNLINSVEDPEMELSQKELAHKIFNSFNVGSSFNEKSVYDYLRKEEQSRPLNPIFIIKKNENRNDFFDYLLYKSVFRKRGQAYNPNNLQPYDTKIIEQILGHYDYNQYLERESIDRKYWENKASINSVRLVDIFIDKYLKPISDYKPRYLKNRIGIEDYQTGHLFVSFIPRKKSIVVCVKLEKANDIDNQIENLELETLPYMEQLKQYRFRIKNRDIGLNDKFFIDLIKMSFEMNEY